MKNILTVGCTAVSAPAVNSRSGGRNANRPAGGRVWRNLGLSSRSQTDWRLRLQTCRSRRGRLQWNLCAVLALLSLLILPTITRAETTAYVLAPDDQIDISVQGHDDLKESATVLPDGTFSYPILHTVHAAGLTLDGLTQTITIGLDRSSQLNAAQVTVSLRQSRPRKVSVAGDVKTPGLYDYRDGLRLRDLVLQSGGPLADPGLTLATLLTTSGKSLDVDLAGLLDGSKSDQNLPLAPGDLLFVRAQPDKQIQITGEVVKPGAYTVSASGLSLSAALLEAGGATLKAALSRAQILHAGRVQTIDLHPLLSKLDVPTGNLRLEPGDVLLIPANTARIAVLGEVHTPAAYDIPDGGALTVTDALILAGSVTDDGDSKNIILLRRGPNGRLVQLTINLDDVLHGRATQDAPMQTGDILYVPGRHTHGLSTAQLISFLPFVGLFGGHF